MSIKFELFTCKEHYLAFRKAFAKAVNDERAKSQLKPGYDNTKYRVKGWLKAEHFILLNLLRDKPINRGFSMKTRKMALLNGHEPHLEFKRAIEFLREICEPKIRDDSWWGMRRDEFLEPLEGTVTVEMLNKLYVHIPEIKGLCMWSRNGAKIIAELISGEMTQENAWKEVIRVD